MESQGTLKAKDWGGRLGAIRTRDLPLRRRLLYPTELRAHISEVSAVRGKLRQRTVSLYRSMSYGLFCPGTI